MRKFYALFIACFFLASLGFSQTVSIYDIQFSMTGPSPYDGDTAVTTSGIVTAHEGGSFWIQDSAKAWNGLFVFSSSTASAVTVGDSITLTGEIDEFFDLTEMKNVSSVVNHSSGHTLPAPMVLTTGASAAEAYESVLVTVVSATCTDDDVGANFGQWELNDGSGPVLVDDLIMDYFPTLNCIYTVTGPMYYSFSEYKIINRDSTMDVVLDSCGSGGGPGPSGDTLSIYDIQYTTNVSGDSPEDGNNVTTWGIVTCANTGAGYWIEDSSAAWNGLYVFAGTNTPAIGDELWVNGTIDEFFNQTEMSISQNGYNKVSSGNTVPAPLVVSTAAANQEMFEGVFIRVENANCTNDDVAGNFGQWELNDGTGVILINDLMYAYTPTAGKTYNVQGPLAYSFSEWKIEPCGANDVEEIVGLENVPMIPGLRIYPNPAQTQLNVELDGEGFDKVALYSTLGKLVLSMNGASSTTLEVSDLPRGIYLLKVTVGGLTSTARVILR